MSLAFVHMSPSSKRIFGCVHFSVWQHLSLRRHRPCTKAKTLPARDYQGHNALMPPHFFQKFSKKSDNLVETNRTSERFFDGNSNSRKVKMMVCVRWQVAIRSSS
jgi:hypothetical protein